MLQVEKYAKCKTRLHANQTSELMGVCVFGFFGFLVFGQAELDAILKKFQVVDGGDGQKY